MKLHQLPVLLLAFICVRGFAAPGPDEAPFSRLGIPAERIAAQQEIADRSRAFSSASDDSKAWFAAVKAARDRQEDPEVRAALEAVLAFDPAVRPAPVHGRIPKNYPAPEGSTPQTKLAETERLLDGRRTEKDLPLKASDLAALARSEDFAIAQRASRLLRRVSSKEAAPILWERLAKATQRSQAQEIEDEILRLPSSVAARTAPVSLAGSSPAARAAWLRVVACRPGVKVDKAAVLPLLKGPANEVSEAAWDAAPRIFTAKELPQLQEASQGLSERLASRAKAALELVR
ncbi:MAG: hypothetical protein ACO3ND_04210 [Opitutales bacterium]